MKKTEFITHSKEPTLREEMIVGNLYLDIDNETLLVCASKEIDRIYIDAVQRFGDCDLYNGTDMYFMIHLPEVDDIEVYDVGPKEDHPEYFL